MSTQQMLNFNPPRIVNVPQQPLPQTVCMTLEHSGIPYENIASITDIPPDFGWMTQLQYFDFAFRYSNQDDPGKEVAVFEVQTVINPSGGNPENWRNPPWFSVPFFFSRWWNGTIGFKLVAIKPPRVTGKLLIRYSFDPHDDFKSDSRKRGIAKEWDLGQSSECEFDVTGVNTIQARPTWLPSILQETTTIAAHCVQTLPLQEYHFGRISIEAAQRLQVGSIFPDSIRILVFKIYKAENFYLPTDSRGKQAHFLTLGTLVGTLKDLKV